MSTKKKKKAVFTPASMAARSSGRVFTQDQVDQIVKDRLGKFADYDVLKKKVEELESAVSDARVEGKKESDQAWGKKYAEAFSSQLIKDLRFRDSDDVRKVFNVEDFIKDGEVDEAGITDAIKRLAADKPYLVNNMPPAAVVGGGVSGGDFSAGLAGKNLLAAAFNKELKE